VFVAVPADDARDSVRQLLSLLAIGLPGVVAVLGTVTWLLVGRALRPVELLRQQAAAISGTDLHRRVDVPSADDELASLARTLNDLLERAEAAFRQQRAFVGDAAHELRSPIAALLTQLDVDARTDSPEARADLLAALRGQVTRLARLVEALLTLARIDAGAPRATPVDLDDVVVREVSEFLVRQPATSLRCDVAAARVLGESVLLGQAVRNLLDNAARHARRHVHISLVVESEHAVLAVADDGAGIAPLDRERVFERFTRLQDGRDRDSGGAGLGLAIVRDVVVAHGGAVVCQPRGPGARFVVRLPLDRSASPSATGTTGSTGGGNQCGVGGERQA
jgi:signal transduction histidine kinase